MSHEDRTVVTCLDASGRWRPARLTLSPLVIGNSNNEKTEGASPSQAMVIGSSNNQEGEGWRVEFLEGAARGSATPLDSGVVTGGFTDWHVHLHLIDSAGLAGSPITRVLDLGGDPGSLAQTAQAARLAQTQSNNTARPPEVLYAGAFLTPSGGYPSDRSWAPEATYREVTDSRDAAAAVRDVTGLVIGSVVFSLPFVVQPIRNAFEAIGERPFDVAATLGAGPLDRFLTVALPLARPGILTATVLAFAHTVGEFGVVLMIGGNIPGQTQVVSITILELVETLKWGKAHLLAGGLVVFAFSVILAVSVLERRSRRLRG